MRVLVRVGGDVFAVVQAECFGLGAQGLGRGEEGLVVVRLADRFAVPARALRVDFAAGEFLVALRRPLEGARELVLFDLVVVVDELAMGVGNSVRIVVSWGQLVGVPGEVNVKRGNDEVARVLAHDLEEDGVFFNKAGNGGFEGRRMDPVDGLHFLDEDTLAEDGTDEVEGEG